MLGAIVGDIVGSRFEFNNHRNKEFDLFAEGCFVTDDSVMTLAVAKAIMEDAKTKSPSTQKRDDDYCTRLPGLAVKYMREIGRKYPNCGFGGMFRRWVFCDTPEPYNSFGNGAAMRVSPAGFAATSERDAERLAEAVTGVTHNHEEGIKGAKATAIAIFMARNGALKSEIRERIAIDFYPLDFRIDDIRATYKFSETCQETVPQAIECFLESTSFEDAIRTAVSLGGDSDTIAAITGAIAEAYYGVPDDIKEKALGYLDKELLAIYEEWLEFAPPKTSVSNRQSEITEISLNIFTFHNIEASINLRISFNADGVEKYAEPHNRQCFSQREAEELRERFSNIHTEHWNTHYSDPEVCVLDGTDWALTVRYSDGRALEYRGSNYYPDNFNELLNFFGIEQDEKDEII
ncbi:MAG: ADP-ribosylglycohydrolase family protein [Oscillospiraceae bacterium]|jgi:ADP-ribosylglycohydrolase|nr:ADP-ribosylglycohydrolase family protein [Oscillospiraceae bacterium]